MIRRILAISRRVGRRKFSTDNLPTGDGYLRMLASSTPEDIDQMLGPKRIRSTKIEAAVRMLADHFLMYDAMDKALMNEDLNTKFGADPVVDVDKDVMKAIKANDAPLLDELRAKFHSKYDLDMKQELSGNHQMTIEAGVNTPRYSNKSSHTAMNELHQSLNELDSSVLSTLANKLMNFEAKPDRRMFHTLIRQLLSMRYTRPAQIALDCLLTTDLDLSPETLLLAINIAKSNADMWRFYHLTRVFPSMVHVDKKLDETMSADPLGKWFDQKSIDWSLYHRLFRNAAKAEVDQNSGPAFGAMAQCMFRFQWFDQIDRLITAMARLGVPYGPIVLAINFKTAKERRDKLRFDWTCEQLEDLNFKSITKHETGRLKTAAFSAAPDLANDSQIQHLSNLF